ncbi:probable uridine nucleosidase 2 [Manduca sexta]|uniref:probable uridine nucleosidase 2 n=1 Tax=Manduca sexta TaxID=7130 RepID=UPI00188EF9E6|nr:probable uridine nucleosidase 2 [Manduca sexta]
MVTKLFFLYSLYFFQSSESCVCKHDVRKKLVIDHDGGADDGMAIFMAVLYERYFNGPDVVALTTTYGNVDEKQSFENTQRILDIANRRDIPIYRGSHRSLVIDLETDNFFGIDGLGDNDTVNYEPIPAQRMHAVQGLIELSKKYKDKLVVMTVGPLTNVALAIRLDPGFLGRISQLYIGAGRIYDIKNPEPEFNAEMDVEAYRVVADAATDDKVTVITLGIVESSLDISRNWRVNVLGAIPTAIMKAQNVFERVSIKSSDRWTLLDPAVAAVVLDKEIVEEEITSKHNIIVHEPRRGVNTDDFESKEPNVKLTYKLDLDYYRDLLLKIFTAELK